MSEKNYFFLLFTFYFGFFTKNKTKIKGKRQCVPANVAQFKTNMHDGTIFNASS